LLDASHFQGYNSVTMVKKVELIEKLYNENVDKIYRYFYTHTNNQYISEDLTSKTFMKVLEKISTYDETKAQAITWLFAIARNTLIDHYRLLSTRKTISLQSFDRDPEESSNNGGSSSIEPGSIIPMSASIISNFGNKEIERSVQLTRNKEILTTAIQDLNEEEQLIIFLRFTQELSYEEIALELRTSTNVVGLRIHRTLNKLRKVLEKNGGIKKLDK
jgi:RNA polymerase sigma factor (sigma-70 family)